VKHDLDGLSNNISSQSERAQSSFNLFILSCSESTPSPAKEATGLQQIKQFEFNPGVANLVKKKATKSNYENPLRLSNDTGATGITHHCLDDTLRIEASQRIYLVGARATLVVVAVMVTGALALPWLLVLDATPDMGGR